jgi:hypothetical protein
VGVREETNTMTASRRARKEVFFNFIRISSVVMVQEWKAKIKNAVVGNGPG